MLIYTSYPKCSFTRPIFKTLLNKTIWPLKIFISRWQGRRWSSSNYITALTFWDAFGSKVKGKWKYKQQTHPHNTPNLPRLLACGAGSSNNQPTHPHNMPNLPRKKTVKTVEQCSFQRHYMTHMNVFYKNIYKTKQASLFDVKFSTSCTFDVQYIEFIRIHSMYWHLANSNSTSFIALENESILGRIPFDIIEFDVL